MRTAVTLAVMRGSTDSVSDSDSLHNTVLHNNNRGSVQSVTLVRLSCRQSHSEGAGAELAQLMHYL